MTEIRTAPWRTEDFLETPEDVASYLEAAFEDGNAKLVRHALGVVARPKERFHHEVTKNTKNSHSL